MNAIIYVLVWSIVRTLQAMPLGWVARLGRAAGALAYILDVRHRRVAIKNLTQCFSKEMTSEQIRDLARQNFRRIGENYCCAVKTATMPWERLRRHVKFTGGTPLTENRGAKPGSVVVAIGHFGNFELYARLGDHNPDIECGTTYRALQPAALNKLLQSLRNKSGCTYFERRTELAALQAWMAPEGHALGFLSDQHAGRSGVRAPFFGVDCATTAAPAVFALRYNQPLYVGVCYRTGLAQWTVEFSGPLATHEDGRPRPVEDIIRDVNQALEIAVRRDPANWFWVHNRWKPDKLPDSRPQRPKETAPARVRSS
jgi:KDO2-lipid IV(A) lauroyltransferase